MSSSTVHRPRSPAPYQVGENAFEHSIQTCDVPAWATRCSMCARSSPRTGQDSDRNATTGLFGRFGAGNVIKHCTRISGLAVTPPGDMLIGS